MRQDIWQGHRTRPRLHVASKITPDGTIAAMRIHENPREWILIFWWCPTWQRSCQTGSKPPLSKERCKYCLGFEESGSPFMSILTLSNVLETLFNVLEGILISVAMQSADMFVSIVVFAAPPQCPSSGYQLR